MTEPDVDPEIEQMGLYFNTPTDHYTRCPNCRERWAEVGHERVEYPTNGNAIMIHVLKWCEACDWRRAAEFEAELHGVPPTRESVLPEESEE